jgi:hypothetical protein
VPRGRDAAVRRDEGARVTYCLDHPAEAEADGYPLEAVERMFLKLA